MKRPKNEKFDLFLGQSFAVVQMGYCATSRPHIILSTPSWEEYVRNSDYFSDQISALALFCTYMSLKGHFAYISCLAPFFITEECSNLISDLLNIQKHMQKNIPKKKISKMFANVKEFGRGYMRI